MARKRSWNEASAPAPPPGTAPQPESNKSWSPVVPKVVPLLTNGLLRPPVPPSSSGIFNAASAQLELAEKSRDSCSEASKLTSEVAFWLRHLTIPMARTLTSTNGIVQKPSPEKQLSNGSDDASSSNGDDASSDSGDNEPLVRWPGIDSVMVLYMAHQQGIFLTQLFERIHPRILYCT